MKFILKTLLTALAIVALAYVLPGIHVADYNGAIWTSILITVLRYTFKPLMIVLTLPMTIISLGLFLFVINACVILVAAHFLDEFWVDGFWWALLFSILLSFSQEFIDELLKDTLK